MLSVLKIIQSKYIIILYIAQIINKHKKIFNMTILYNYSLNNYCKHILITSENFFFN